MLEKLESDFLMNTAGHILRLILKCIFTLILISCVQNDQTKVEAFKKKSWPNDINEWPIEIIQNSFCKVSYINKAKQRIVGSGVAISVDGFVLTTSHFIRAVISDFGQKVHMANEYALNKNQLDIFQKQIDSLEKGENLILDISMLYQNKNYFKCLLVGYNSALDIVLLKFDCQTPEFLKIHGLDKLKNISDVGSFGVGGSRYPLFAFGKLLGEYNASFRNSFAVPNCPGDSGAPIFTKDGFLIGILTDGEFFEKISPTCLASPIYSELVSKMMEKVIQK